MNFIANTDNRQLADALAAGFTDAFGALFANPRLQIEINGDRATVTETGTGAVADFQIGNFEVHAGDLRLAA